MKPKSRKGKLALCDCGRPAFKLVRNEPVCARCSGLEQISWHAEVPSQVGPFDPILCAYRITYPGESE